MKISEKTSNLVSLNFDLEDFMLCALKQTNKKHFLNSEKLVSKYSSLSPSSNDSELELAVGLGKSIFNKFH